MIRKDPRDGDERNIIAHTRRDSRDLACSEHGESSTEQMHTRGTLHRQCVIAATRSESDVFLA